MTRDGARVHHGVACIELRLPGVDSLKGKRALLRRTEARLHSELGCAVAEVAHQDRRQRAAIAIATVSGSATGVDRVLDRVTAIVERDPRVEVLRVTEDADTLDTEPLDLP